MNTQREVSFAIAVPQVFPNGRIDMALVRDSLQAGEELGFAGAWTQDQVIGDAPLLESIGLLSYAAACTTRLSLGVSVIVFPVRNPVQLAKSVTTLDHLSQGRAVVGLGLGPPAVAERFYRSFGTRYTERVRRFTEGLQIMRALWQEPQVTLDGEFWQLEQTAMEPKPVQQPGPPVIFGGQHPQALQRAARLADGYMGAGPTSTRAFAGHIAQLRHFLAEQGRSEAEFPVSKRVYLHVADDAAEAKQVLDEFFTRRYPWMIRQNPDFVADVCVWGNPEACAAGLQEVVRSGAEMIVLNPVLDFPEQFERLAREVLPRVDAA